MGNQKSWCDMQQIIEFSTNLFIYFLFFHKIPREKKNKNVVCAGWQGLYGVTLSQVLQHFLYLLTLTSVQVHTIVKRVYIRNVVAKENVLWKKKKHQDFSFKTTLKLIKKTIRN